MTEQNIDAADVASAEEFEIKAAVVPVLNYASWQNSVPVVTSVKVANNRPLVRNGFSLELSFTPAIARSVTWTLDRLTGEEELDLANPNVELDAKYLSSLDEAERAIAIFSLKNAQGEEVAELRKELRLLARDEWGGFDGMASITAAFVMPNDPTIPAILRKAGEILERFGHSPSLNGYQSQDPKRAYMLAAALWSSVASMGLLYAEPPKSFERVGQKVRRPSTVKEQGLGTCFDTTLLFASALEAMGLNPLILLTHGHSYCGVWLKEMTLPSLVEEDPIEIRKALAARELIVFETTSITKRPADQFDKAIAIAQSYTNEKNAADFIGAIDIARSRASQIRPMAAHQAAGNSQQDGDEPELPASELPLPKEPSFADLSGEVIEEKPSNARDRIARWQNKLLDLSLRNRLLNFSSTKQTVPFICSNVPKLEDLLADQNRIRIISLPEENPHGERDEKLFAEKTGQDLDREFVTRALDRNELATTLEKNEMENRLIGLFRRAKSDMTEGGSNTLFLAVGFLRWKKSEKDEKSYRAPILLIPVSLTRRSANSRFFLEHHEDDVRFNATLREFLKKDFSLELPAFDEALPTDESGIDVPLVFETIRRIVRDVPGFEVLDEAALSTFSFAKFLMWKDLVERTDELRKNRVVRHLIDSPEQAFEPTDSSSIPRTDELDLKYHPVDIVTPLPADSSQLSAVMAAAEGKDFVLVGPPGTGKSQTITNMIAQCLANGKSVLFVAEKTAALGVVYRRLKEHGLGDFCLELHSNRAEKKQFISQLQASWEKKTSGASEDWVRINERLEVHRDQLNQYVTELHAPRSCGLSVFQALGLSVKHADAFIPKLDWDRSIDVGEERLQQLQEIVGEIASVHRQVVPIPALELVRTNNWSNRWVGDLMEAASSLSLKADVLASRVAEFASLSGLDGSRAHSMPELQRVAWLAKLVCSTEDKPLAVVFEDQLEKIRSSVDELSHFLDNFKAAQMRLAAEYEESEILRLPIDDIDRDWRLANSKMWPFSAFAKRKTRKFLKTYARSGLPDPDRELAPLRDMQMALRAMEGSAERQHYPNWQGTSTDTKHLQDYFELASKIKAAFAEISYLGSEALERSENLKSCISSGAKDHPLRRASGNLVAAWDEFNGALASLRDIANTDETWFERQDILRQIQGALVELKGHSHQLQVWTEWQKVKSRAAEHHLSVFVEAVEKQAVPHEQLELSFLVSFANWWLPDAIDRSDTLRSFKRFRHEEMLAQFRLLDDKARAAAASKVQTALSHGLPEPHSVSKTSELGVLRHQMGLKRPSKSIRDMISSMPSAFNKLAPCLLMSPLSIAQYLPAGQALFDVVIFDEASQITTWDAVGAIARGKQTIIVGDPKQLPPTNFFGRAESDDDDDDLEAYEKDLESILDEARVSGLTPLQLNWHYRSRSESLIAFSNWHYYNNRLITFPSPNVDDRAVKLVRVPNAVYDRGKSRTNMEEASKIVRLATAKLENWLRLAETERPTLGVITFNHQQQSLIQDLFDAELRQNSDLEWFFSDDRVEPVIVRNLENVQGDERDVMMFSITFGPDMGGKMSMSFGAINKDGGERRLNVAVTRARAELLVVSTITADSIDVSKSKALGVRHLKEFLAYAEKGPIALQAADTGSQGGFDSPFEEAVSEALEARGWTVIPQIGVSDFRIDLGVVHPDRSGAFIAGIECDGATYHRSATARDRDKVREQILRNLGWEILRIWSPDWWYDAAGVADGIHQKLTELVEASREKEQIKAADDDREQHAETINHPIDSQGLFDVTGQGTAASCRGKREEEQPKPVQVRENLLSADQQVAANQNAPLKTIRIAKEATSAFEQTPSDVEVYRLADLGGFSVKPEQFFEVAYSSTLARMVEAVVSAEGPIKDTLLAQRITKAHGWARTGNRLRDRIFSHLRSFECTEEATGRFIWTTGEKKDIVPFRVACDLDNRRAINDIALAEIAGLINDKPGLLNSEQPIYAIAHEMGYDRVASAIQTRVADAIDYYRNRNGLLI